MAISTQIINEINEKIILSKIIKKIKRLRLSSYRSKWQ